MPGPEVRTTDNVFGEAVPVDPAANIHSGAGTEAKPERKLTVLESHGYVLGRTIGSGSYATVKVASSERHNCQVAVKIISKFQAPGDYLKKFLPREIEVVKGLKHENLIRFLQAIETTHRVYIVMEYAENGSLLDIIRKDQHIDEIRGRRWFRQLVDAVDYCHERGVVHRDIKCENLLMDYGMNIKLSDFGFARGHMKPKNGVFALSETFCGSYAYASPEILKGVPYRPQESDVWSMGVVLYAIVFGRLPFDDTNYTQLLKQVQNKVTFPREPKVSSECRKLITRILAPLKVRVKIPQILADPWLNPNQPRDSTEDTKDEKDERTWIYLFSSVGGVLQSTTYRLRHLEVLPAYVIDMQEVIILTRPFKIASHSTKDYNISSKDDVVNVGTTVQTFENQKMEEVKL